MKPSGRDDWRGAPRNYVEPGSQPVTVHPPRSRISEGDRTVLEWLGSIPVVLCRILIATAYRLEERSQTHLTMSAAQSLRRLGLSNLGLTSGQSNMMTARHLPDDRIHTLYAAAIACGLAADPDGLLAGLPPAYTATLPSSGTPAARLLQTLHLLNGVPALSDGTIPLAVWLRNAMTLAIARVERNIFVEAMSAMGGASCSTPGEVPLSSSPSLRERPARLFLSYARADVAYRQALTAHLAPLRTNGLIADWHDGEIVPGEEWEARIHAQLDAADVIVLLLSADFFASQYINRVEIPRALERHATGAARVVPVVVRAVEWKHSPLARLQGLPDNGVAVKSWADQDEAWANVAAGIRRVVEGMDRSSCERR